MEKAVEKGLTYWQILGWGLIYVGIILFAVIIITVLIEWLIWRKEIKRQKEKSKQPIRYIRFDKKI